MYENLDIANEVLRKLIGHIDDKSGVFEINYKKTIHNIMKKFYTCDITIMFLSNGLIDVNTILQKLDENSESENQDYVRKVDGELDYIINNISEDFERTVNQN